MTSTIDHSIREKLGINAVQYLVAEYCAKCAPLMSPTGIKAVSESIGLSSHMVTECTKELISLSLLYKKENGYFYPTIAWYEAQMGEDIEVQSDALKLTKDVIDYFNSVNGTRYQAEPNLQSVKSIMKKLPSVTLQHFQSVISHKSETWRTDPVMALYNRPMTILGSKFIQYLEDANHYWLQKSKQ